LGRRRARRDLRGRQVVDHRPERVGRVDVAAVGDVEVVDEGRRRVASRRIERGEQGAAGDVVDLDGAGRGAGRVEPAPEDLHPGGGLPLRAGDEHRYGRGRVAERAAVDAAVAHGRDEEGAAALVERDALRVAVLRFGQRVDLRLAAAGTVV